jgi:hypothetical protein
MAVVVCLAAGPALAAAQPVVTLSPTSLNFGNQQVGTTSPGQNITLSNTGTGSLSITKISLTGSNAADYAQTNTCGSSVAAGASCTISVTFTPSKIGTRAASVNIADNATGSPQSVSLSGSGTGPYVKLTPSTLTFAGQNVGTTSPAQNVTLKNTGTASLTITSIAATGDYAQTNTCGSGLAANKSCTISVTFTPTQAGMRTGAVNVTDNAIGSPQSVALSGTGISVNASPSLTVLGPATRTMPSAILDSATNTMLVFGGQNTGVADLNDLWSWAVSEDTSVDWLPVTAQGSVPAARYGHTAVYDSTNSRMTVFGGAEGLSSAAPCENDVWLLQNANGVGGTPTWMSVATSGGVPRPRYAHAAAYDAATDTMMVFGGSDCAAGFFNEVWTLSHANGLGGIPNWKQLTVTGTGPVGRESSSVVYDAGSNELIVFGGDSGPLNTLNDVWMLSHANGTGGTPNWTQLFPTGTAPTARTGHTAIYDRVNNRMTIFGGVTGSGIVLADAWVLIGANGKSGTPAWSMINPTTAGVPRAYHSVVYNTSTNEMIVFAGEIAGNTPDDHLFVLSKANGLP